MFRMKTIFFGLVLSATTIAGGMAFAANGVEGLWLTENKRSVIDVHKCGENMCGKIHWIIEGGMQVDSKNPDETLRGQPMCGLMIMQGLEDDGNNEWEDGTIYKADDGEYYDADIELNDDDTLHVRGYRGVSLFGKSQTWTRVSKEDYPKCNPA